MADHTEKKKAGAINHFLSREQFNSLCSVMSFIVLETDENRYTDFADYMLFKLIKFSIDIEKTNDENSTYLVRLYPNEAQLLLQIYIIFVTGYMQATDREIKNYTSIVGTEKIGYKYDKRKNICKKIEEMI